MNPNEIHNRIVNNISQDRKNWVDIAEGLYNLKVGENFRDAVGEGVDTWVSYISQPEIGLSKGEADKLVMAYYKLVVENNIMKERLYSISRKNLLKLIDVVQTTDNNDIDDLVHSAINLSHRDFKDLLHDMRQVTDIRTYSYVIMRKCNETGNLNKVKEISSEQIKTAFNLND